MTIKKTILFIILSLFLIGCENKDLEKKENLNLNFTEETSISFYNEDPVKFSYFESEGNFSESEYSTIILLGKISNSTINDIIEKTDDFEENFNFILLDEADEDSLLDVINTFRSSDIEITDYRFYLISDDDNEEIVKKINEKNNSVFANYLTISDSETNLNEKITELLDKKRSIIYNSILKTKNFESSDSEAYKAIDNSEESKWLNTSDKDKEIIFTFDKKQNIFRYKITSDKNIQNFRVEILKNDKWINIESFENYDSKVIDRYIPVEAPNKIRLVFEDESISIEEIQIFSEYELVNEFKYKEFSYKHINIPYRIYVPDNIDNYDKIPLIMALHGSGQRGKDNRQTLGTTKSESGLIYAFPEVQEDNPSIVVIPQSGENKLWRDEDLIEATFALLENLKAEYPSVDGDRIYATGMSTGAEGLANMAIVKPDYFAALILVGGGPNNPVGGAEFVIDTVVPNSDKIADIPTWFIQAYDDSVRSIDLTNKMINEYRSLGYNPKYTVYLPDVVLDIANSSHSSWLLSYKDQRIIDWLFKQNKTERLTKDSPLSPIPEMTNDEVMSISNPDLNYIDFDNYFKD